ncbi:agmatinase family protein [Hazenella sp. IB182353]|uniref:agmatinase family protein n=1 Tax=Polycladospora coralii TaxID=2771432 RepID=UPI001746A438|nr:agmatinase family protein [Polycladospora coralii]MBS7531106.1 agmatinase family protein [Polycladospora coralii]
MFQYLNPAPIQHQQEQVDPLDLKVAQWIKPRQPDDSYQIGFVGVPLSRSSISASAASESPLAVRQSWRGFATYDVDHDVDLTPLQVRDLGDIRMHTTDIGICHQNIEQGMAEVYAAHQDQKTFIPLIMGGDHSITCPSVKAFVKANPGKRVGLIQFDTHFDVRSLESGGPSNGTPIRGLIESGTLRGEDVMQLGIHSFANSRAYKAYVDEQGITYYTMRQIRERGMQVVLNEALALLKAKVDLLYVTVDIDVLDQAALPGSPGSSPGGLTSWELFEAVYQLGQEEQVHAFDMVCLDPFRDVGSVSVRTVTHVMLSFLSGICKANHDFSTT